MARSRRGKTTPEAAKENGNNKTLSFRVVTDVVEETPTYYVNYIEVASSQFEFALIGCKLPTKMSESRLAQARETGVIRVEPEVQMLLPVSIIDRLIEALQKQKAMYEANYVKRGGDAGNEQERKGNEQ